MKTKRENLELRQATLDEIFALRWEILRPNRPRAAAEFPGDDAPTTRHFAALENGCVVGCLTFHASKWENQPAWQLRGMAVAPKRQRQGVGGKLLEFSEQAMRNTSPVRHLWCNARQTAIQFYERQGWQIASEEFEIPDAGPHVRMTKRL